MSITTTGQHQLKPFPSPVKGQTPDFLPDTIRGNDNLLQTALNAHDADQTMHVMGDATTFVPIFLLMGA